LATDASIPPKRLGVFANRNFSLLFSGRVVSQLGDQVYSFALSWYILDRTGSGLQMSIFLVVNALVSALVSPFGGVIADRLSRKAILVWMDLIQGAVVVAAALLLYLKALDIWMLYASAIALGFCGSIFNPTSGAIVPNIVTDEELPRATSMFQFANSFCMMGGLVLGGLLYSWLGIASVFLINAISFFASAGLEALLQVGPHRGRSEGGAPTGKSPLGRQAAAVLRELAEGYRYVRGNSLVFSLTIMFSIYYLIILPLGFVYLPFIFNTILKASSFQLGLSLGSLFIGQMAASFVVPGFLHRYKLRDGIFWGLLVLGASQALGALVLFSSLRGILGNWGITWCFFGISLVMGVAMTFFVVPVNLIFQKSASDEYRGRFWGFFASISSLAVPAGYLLGGLLTQRIPMAWVLLASAAMFLLLGAWVASLREVRDLRE
jgi:MFS transporter, DHA3 family, macrolide efflux protein